MKNLIISTAFLIGSVPAFAFPTPNVSPSPGPGDTSNEIAAQMAITRRGVDELLKKAGQSNVPSSVKVADYWEVTPAFRKSVEDALTRFEDSLKKDILETNVGPVMNNYNAIVTSPSISDDQKVLLLKQQAAFVKGQANRIEALYAKTIEKAYEETGLRLYALQYSSVDRPDRKTRKLCGITEKSDIAYLVKLFAFGEETPVVCKRVPYVYTTRRSNDSDGRLVIIFEDGVGMPQWERNSEKNPDYVFPRIPELVTTVINQFRTGCRSQVCIGLRAADAITTLTQMQSLFSRNLEMKLADGTPFTIHAPSFTWQATLLALQRADLYGTDDLPFDTN